MTAQTWLTPAETTRGRMIAHARDRGVVKLTEGRTARLVCWRSNGRHRIEFPSGARRTVKTAEIAYVLAEVMTE